MHVCNIYIFVVVCVYVFQIWIIFLYRAHIVCWFQVWHASLLSDCTCWVHLRFPLPGFPWTLFSFIGFQPWRGTAGVRVRPQTAETREAARARWGGETELHCVYSLHFLCEPPFSPTWPSMNPLLTHRAPALKRDRGGKGEALDRGDARGC